MHKRKSRRRSGGGSGGWLVLVALGLTAALVVVFAGSAAFRALEVAPMPGQHQAREAAAAPVPDRAGIKVEVWNGSGVSGAGQKVAEALRDGGFTVTELRNADRSDYGTTLVVDRKGNRRAVQEVIQSIHGGMPLLMRSPASTVDVRVVVGRDHPGLKLTP